MFRFLFAGLVDDVKLMNELTTCIIVIPKIPKTFMLPGEDPQDISQP